MMEPTQTKSSCSTYNEPFSRSSPVPTRASKKKSTEEKTSQAAKKRISKTKSLRTLPGKASSKFRLRPSCSTRYLKEKQPTSARKKKPRGHSRIGSRSRIGTRIRLRKADFDLLDFLTQTLRDSKKSPEEKIARRLFGSRKEHPNNTPMRDIANLLCKQYMKIRRNKKQKEILLKALSTLASEQHGNKIDDRQRIVEQLTQQIENKGFRYLLRDLLLLEIKEYSHSAETLFRVDSIATLLFTPYQKIVFSSLLQKLFSSQSSSRDEFSPRVSESDEKNQIDSTKTFLEKLTHLLETNKTFSFMNLTKIYQKLYSQIERKFDEDTAKKQILSFFIFRILVPEMYVTQHPLYDKYVAKILMQIINTIESDTKEVEEESLILTYAQSAEASDAVNKIISLLTKPKRNPRTHK